MPDHEETPYQEAKRLGMTYVKLLIDERHLKPHGSGRITVEGPVTERIAELARNLLTAIIEEDPDA